MTQEDLRDIAAYYGATFTVDYGPGVGSSRDCLDHEGIRRIAAAGDDAEVLLGLRPISSLTDEEKTHIWKMLNVSTDYPLDNQPTISDVLGGELQSMTLALSGSLITHLQSIGIYVKGTIDEKYVQLTEF